MKFVSRLVVGLLLAFLTACGERPENKEPSRSPPVVKNGTVPHVRPSAAYEKQQKEEYQLRLEAILNGYVRRLDDLKAKTTSSVSTTKDNAADIIAELEVKTEAVRAIIDRLKSARLESWHALKPDIHATLDDFEVSYDKAVLALRDSPEPRNPVAGRAMAEGVLAIRTAEQGN